MKEELDQLNSPIEQLIILGERGMNIVLAPLIILVGFWRGKSIIKV